MTMPLRRCLLICTFACSHILGFALSASADTWIWFRSVTTGSEWWPSTGQGDVHFSRGVFKATLRDGTDKSERIVLTGSVSNGVVTARGDVLGTDEPPLRVSGRLKRLCWEKGGGREILILTDHAEVIGLFRELTSAQQCKPVP